jgi:hypothetical protein
VAVGADKALSQLPKNELLLTQKMVYLPSLSEILIGSRIWNSECEKNIFRMGWIPDPGVKKAPIPDPDPLQ